jgi:accessory colonization factor AcfC
MTTQQTSNTAQNTAVAPQTDPARRRVLQASLMAAGLIMAGSMPSVLAQTPASAASVLKVYGPGGPAPAMHEAATAFEQATGVKVEVTAGPTPKWIDAARNDADLIFSGSETMMSDFVTAMNGQLDSSDVEPLYLRPLAILVRPGNPKHIRGFKSLLKPGIQVLVVNGAGQNGVWEDAAGRLGDIRTVRALRKNIVAFPGNSALAKQAWIDHPEIDAWLIWNIWQVSNPKLAEQVAVEAPYRIYRDCGIAPTTRGKQQPAATRFIAFLQSAQGKAIFKRWGWMTQEV